MKTPSRPASRKSPRPAKRSSKGSGGWRGAAWRWTWRLAAIGLVLGAVGAVLGGLGYRRYVVDEPGDHISRDAILEIIAQESPILYSDGTTRLGVFFAREHREYVPFERIPKAWTDAIVAAEDDRFWTHPGIDWQGIVRAMVKNAKAGRVVAGGSTLTQQTAKNLYYRPDRSLRSKVEEALNALRLERHHSKQEILEFYANQFHVSSNGRGLGIAARYFFDKEVEELTPLECAFLAGMVKAPATYNPFLGASEERRAEARRKAQLRTRYVLDRMVETGVLSQAEHDKLATQEIPFKRGTFRYDTSVLIDEVAHRLEQAPFPELFAELGIDNPSTAGISVVTTLHAEAQREATYALWHHLSEVGPLIEGQGVAALQLPADRAPRPDPDHPPEPHTFVAGKVTGSSAAALRLDVGGHGCTVDAEGLDRMAAVLAQARKGESWRTATRDDVAALVDALPAGTVVWASLRSEGLCDLELRPELQGALLVLEQGRIRAMVGGNDNRNFNRAITARRQLGSTWKPILYYAALQLGWTPVDPLDNRRNVFTFEGTWYYPRPDHQSEDFVSLAWAGTRSENLASIWLLHHLTDRLAPDRFEDVATRVDLVPRKGEGRKDWIVRVRDDYGIISTVERLPEIAYYAVRAEVIDELGEGSDDRRELVNIGYGRGAPTERKRILAAKGGSEKLRAVEGNFQAMEKAGRACAAQVEALRALGEAASERSAWERLLRPQEPVAAPDPARFAGLSVRPSGGALSFGCGEQGEGWAPVGEHLLGAMSEGTEVPLGDVGDMVVAGGVGSGLRWSTLQAVRRAMSRRMLVLKNADPYDFEVLQFHPDFRALVGMRYMAGLAARLGVEADLPPVMSLPLGAVDISLEEAGTMYQAMLDGNTWTFPGRSTADGGVAGLRQVRPVASPTTSTQLIAEIRDRNGNVLYRADPAPARAVDGEVGRLAGDVLRNVVRWGTGRRALHGVTLGGRAVPVAGKTGTTNSYKNAAFCGFVPRATPDGWRWGDGFTITAYVGYDDNRPMRRGSTRLQGASAALPAWLGAAQGLADAGLLGATPPDGPEWIIEPGFVAVTVGEAGGLPVETGEEGVGAMWQVPPEQTEATRTVLIRSDRGGRAEDATRLFAPFEPLPTARAEAALPVGVEPMVGGTPAVVPGVGAQEIEAGEVDVISEEELREVWVDGMGEFPQEETGELGQGASGEDGPEAPAPPGEPPVDPATEPVDGVDPPDREPPAPADTGIDPRITPQDSPP